MKIKTSVVLIASLFGRALRTSIFGHLSRCAFARPGVRLPHALRSKPAGSRAAGARRVVALCDAFRRVQQELPEVQKNFRKSIPLRTVTTCSFRKPLFRMQNWIANDQGGMQVQQAEAVFADASQNLIVQLRASLFRRAARRDSVNFSGAQKGDFEQLASKRNFEVGTATITDTYEAQAKYDLAVAKKSPIWRISKSKARFATTDRQIACRACTSGGKAGLSHAGTGGMWKVGQRSGEASPTVAQFRLASEIAKKKWIARKPDTIQPWT